MNARRQFTLPEDDIQFLEEYGLDWETINDGSQWLLLNRFPTGGGYTEQEVTVAIRIETGYPLTPLDMVYFDPALKRKDGKSVPATEATQSIDGRVFQRWSRHRTSENPWKPGVDNIGSHIHLIEDWLQREFEK
jgi:hypothetical protein